jgi:uncharacterized SAM-binding protein YcdF (DUF218 family)
MKKIRLLLLTLLSSFVVWGVGFIVFFKILPEQATDLTTPTDAIVVLTGGRGRVQLGFSLIRQGLGKKLFISGVNPKVNMPALIELQKIQLGSATLPETQLGYKAQNTVENAKETATWAKEQNVQSLRLVTTNYHIWRSMLEFSKALPGVKIIPHPVSEKHQLTYKNLLLLLSEYNKFLWAWLNS